MMLSYYFQFSCIAPLKEVIIDGHPYIMRRSFPYHEKSQITVKKTTNTESVILTRRFFYIGANYSIRRHRK
jgi:hypothetical protein